MCKHIKRRGQSCPRQPCSSLLCAEYVAGVGAGDRGSDSEDENKRETYDPVQPGRATVRRVSSVAGILLIIMRLI